MNTVHRFHLETDGIALAFWEKGEGNRILICTHGYRQEKEQFLQLFDEVPDGWKILAFDQPMHGNTHWDNKDYCFDRVFFRKLWGILLEKYPNAEWNLMGFSMGGKSAMMLHMEASLPVRSVILIAPGGVYTTPLNRFFSYHSIGRPVFHFFLDNPRSVMKVVDFTHRKKWIRPFQYRFIKAHFNNPETSKFLKRFTDIYRNFDFSFPDYGRFTQTQNTEIHLIWGNHDEVVTPDQTKLFLEYLPQTHLRMIDGKHNLIEENLSEVKEIVKTIMTKT